MKAIKKTQDALLTPLGGPVFLKSFRLSLLRLNKIVYLKIVSILEEKYFLSFLMLLSRVSRYYKRQNRKLHS